MLENLPIGLSRWSYAKWESPVASSFLSLQGLYDHARLPPYMATDLYEQGYQAFLDGKDLEDNPHPHGTDNHYAWRDGFLDAEMELGDEDND